MKLFERSIQGLLATGNRLLSSPLKLKLLMIALENLVRAATHTPINFNHQTGHGDLLIKADKSQVQISWQLPGEDPACEHDISNPNDNPKRLDQHGKNENTDNPDKAHNDCNQPSAIFSRFVDEMIRSTRPACDKHEPNERLQGKGVAGVSFRQ